MRLCFAFKLKQMQRMDDELHESSAGVRFTPKQLGNASRLALAPKSLLRKLEVFFEMAGRN
jgi:hypothetical protein